MAVSLAIACLLFSCSEKSATETMSAPSADHFDPKGKAPSATTIAQWEALKNKMPFEDVRDFEEQQKGFIAKPDYGVFI